MTIPTGFLFLASAPPPETFPVPCKLFLWAKRDAAKKVRVRWGGAGKLSKPIMDKHYTAPHGIPQVAKFRSLGVERQAVQEGIQCGYALSVQCNAPLSSICLVKIGSVLSPKKMGNSLGPAHDIDQWQEQALSMVVCHILHAGLEERKA